jgi:large subunit ribosomal protein L18Ae
MHEIPKSTLGETEQNPIVYRMKIFARNEVIAKSRFWYFMHQYRKMKKTTGEILDVNEITEKNDGYVKNYGIWIKYNSRSGTHNMYKELRDVTLNGAVDTLYNDMAGRHRSRHQSIQIIRSAIVDAKDCKKATSMTFHNSKLKFPLPHKILRAPSKQLRSLYSAKRPNTFFK